MNFFRLQMSFLRVLFAVAVLVAVVVANPAPAPAPAPCGGFFSAPTAPAINFADLIAAIQAALGLRR